MRYGDCGACGGGGGGGGGDGGGGGVGVVKAIVVAVVDEGFYLPHQDLQFWKNRFEIPANNIISEPMGRNTAPCIGLAATIIKIVQNK